LLQNQPVEQPMHLQHILQVQQPQQVQRVLPMQPTQHLQQVQQAQQAGLVIDAGAPGSASGIVFVPDTAVTCQQLQLRLLQQDLPGAVLGFASSSDDGQRLRIPARQASCLCLLLSSKATRLSCWFL
jgi:hypothetical protein